MLKLIQKIKKSKVGNGKAGFIILSVLATIWFLFRVIPKPTRASYPCMRATAPFMSGLVVYLLSVVGGNAAYARFKRNWLKSNYSLSLVFLVLFVGAAFTFFAYNPSFSFSNIKGIMFLPIR